MKLANQLKITDLDSGVVIPIEEVTTDQISKYLTDIDFKARQLDEVKKAIKKYAMAKIEFGEQDGKTVAFYGQHRILKSYRMAFSEKLLEKTGTEDDKQMWEYLKAKYTQMTEFTKWG